MKEKVFYTLVALCLLAGFFALAAIAQYAENGNISFLGAMGLLALVAVALWPVINKANKMVDSGNVA